MQMASTDESIGRTRWVHLVPVIFLMYTISYFDRINIGLALPSMSKDLHLTSSNAGLAAGIFFWGYLISFLGAGYLAPRFGAKRVILTALILWGGFAIGTGLVQNYHELLIMRFMLGLSEGPVWTSTAMLLSQWFIQRERARAFGLWNLCLPVGAMLSGPISGLILTYSSWHTMFIIEGLPAWLWAFIWWRQIPTSVDQAKWLPAEEKQRLQTRINAEQIELAAWASPDWWAMLREPAVWLLMGGFSLINMVNYGFGIWLPTALKAASTLSIGYIGLVSALPYLAAIVGLIVVTRSSDRHHERRLHAGIPMIAIGVLLYIGSHIGAHEIVPIMIAFTVMGFFLFMYLPLIFTFTSELLPRSLAIPAMAFIGGFANLFGGFVGPWLVGWLRGVTGNVSLAFGVLAVFGILGGLLVIAIRPKRRRAVVGEIAVSQVG